MPVKDKILKTFHLTPAQAEYLRLHVTGNLSEYIRDLIARDLPDFPQDMPEVGKGRLKKEK